MLLGAHQSFHISLATSQGTTVNSNMRQRDQRIGPAIKRRQYSSRFSEYGGWTSWKIQIPKSLSSFSGSEGRQALLGRTDALSMGRGGSVVYQGSDGKNLKITQITQKWDVLAPGVTFSIGRPFIIRYYRSHLKNFKLDRITAQSLNFPHVLCLSSTFSTVPLWCV
jgi:hypothetical protein